MYLHGRYEEQTEGKIMLGIEYMRFFFSPCRAMQPKAVMILILIFFKGLLA